MESVNVMNKNKIVQYIVGVAAIFTLGIFIGYQLNFGVFSSIQEKLPSVNNDASDADASDANASDANASDANASDANASDADASATDNIMYLQSFSLGSSSVKKGDKVSVDIVTMGACNSAASIVFKSSTGMTFTAQVQDITDNPYIVIPNTVIATTYSVTDVLLVGRNSDNSTFTKQFSKTGANSFPFANTLTVVESDASATNSKIDLKSISLDRIAAKVGDKIYVNISTSEQLTGLKLGFTSNDNKTFTVIAMDLGTTKPYIEIPSTTVSGVYSLTSAILSTDDVSTAYSKNGSVGTTKFNFTTSLNISNATESSFIYNNDDVDSTILTQLYDAPNGTNITINVDSNTLLNGELFDAIKGKNKKLTINYQNNQIVFNGNDINSSKTIDIKMTVAKVSSNENISKLVSDGIVVNFPDNGNLPGKALVRVKATDEIVKVLNKRVYVYVYNESSNDFCEIDTDVTKSSDGYYEFDITHNSDYLIVNKKLADNLVVSQEEENVVSFLKGNTTYLMLIAIAIVVIILVTILIVVLKNKKKKVSSETKNNNSSTNMIQ